MRFGCGALIINEDQEVLLLLRGGQSRNDIGLWSQPGGEIDGKPPFSEDNICDNIIREVYEEVGVHVKIGKFLTKTQHSDHGDAWCAYSYSAKIIKGMPILMEPHKHTMLQWFSFDKLPENINHVTTDAVSAYLNI